MVHLLLSLPALLSSKVSLHPTRSSVVAVVSFLCPVRCCKMNAVSPLCCILILYQKLNFLLYTNHLCCFSRKYCNHHNIETSSRDLFPLATHNTSVNRAISKEICSYNTHKRVALDSYETLQLWALQSRLCELIKYIFNLSLAS